MIEFDFVLNTTTGSPKSHKTSFTYVTGRPNSTVSWETLHDNTECKVSINGEPCLRCNTNAICKDGFKSLMIDCSNVLYADDGPTTYTSCSRVDGGVLDVFRWLETGDWSECPLVGLK